MGRESSVQGQRCGHERRGTDCAGPEDALRALLDEVLADKVLRRWCIPGGESAVGREDEEGEGEEKSAHDLALERELQGVQLRLQGHADGCWCAAVSYKMCMVLGAPFRASWRGSFISRSVQCSIVGTALHDSDCVHRDI